MLNMKKALANILSTTLCIESGTSNGWIYKKYSDGTFEAFKQYPLNVAANAWTSGSGAYYSGIIDFGTTPFTFDTDTAVLVGSAGQQCKLINASLNGTTGYVASRFERGSAAAVSATAWVLLVGQYTS